MLNLLMADMPPPPTLRELSQILGVSPATVSLALRNDPRVAAQTRERVAAAAQEHGYRINPAIASLMSQVRSTRRVAYQETIGWLNFWERPDIYQKTGVEFQLLMWQGALRRAEELGYTLDSIWMREEQMTQRRATDILHARGIRGILIPPLPESADLPEIEWSSFCAITMSYTMSNPHLDRILPDHFSNMQIILRNLQTRGYQRPGLLMPEGYDARSDHRCMAAYAHMQQALPQANRIPAHTCHPTKIEPATIAWLNKHRPDAVITMGTLKGIRQVPGLPKKYRERLGLVLMSNAASDADICGINENPAIIGATAIEQLALLLQNNQHGLPRHPKLIQIEGEWIEGASAPNLG
ncbi:LacI family DNA-binding transcriptional regulator [Cerasicoccus frondis]|uniref:LacI family DNA-binding transcriptional regulator n=1 Tax=Cerasicoccus frondis TaxID=490090 RepID=UPI0028529AFF|nr:LacI family DNA-binding transcriptional regulator [Cerasicoccus frondis]